MTERPRPASTRFNAIDQGFCTIEVAFADDGSVLDYRFLEVSPSFERQTGIENGAGRWMRDIAADQDEHWFQLHGCVALTGGAVRFENFSTPLDRWWSVYAFRIGQPEQRRIGVLFNDITERKRADAGPERTAWRCGQSCDKLSPV
jgi:PAS domain-containing protein